ncbi:DUF1178 family protein [Mesobaculum littorinae]|uniref:DUF1178 family protein n=1 Tax=Mesobaculum littorinae TaxID=2486419 RepID=A0A438AJU5_9RHOB|nr:DUF1178 family protein [Mesobaculum littorinae]RVV98968.1 DUF1178 family protein [Mesobaculum littorinae]
MIRYALRCAEDHRFESWFQSADAFDRLVAAHHVQCPACGSRDIEKTLMAPRVTTSRKAAARQVPADATGPAGPGGGAAGHPAGGRGTAAGSDSRAMLSRPSSQVEAALEELRRKVEASSDYVGRDFAAEARAMHDGSKPERPIYGEARTDEARALIEDGIPVAPLPFLPKRKTN